MITENPRLKKQQLGQYYTKNAKYICTNLISIFPKDSIIFDSFAGNWDLLNLVKKITPHIYAYDIDPQNNKTIEHDSIKYPIKLKNAWVITNPYFL